MNVQNSLIACAAGLAIAGPTAFAGPVGNSSSNDRAFRGLPDRTAQFNSEQSNFADNFDSYPAGAGVAGNGTWILWPGGNDGEVVTTQSVSPSNSVTLGPETDLVQQFAITSGKWEFKIQTYTPSTAPEGEGLFLIMLNQWGATNNWSMQIALNDAFSGGQTLPWMIESQWDGAVLPLILDQWVEFRAEIDLDNDTMNTFYGGTPLGVDLMWTENNFAGGPGVPEIAAINLYSAGIEDSQMYLDDISLTQLGACPCACNFDTSTGAGTCDIFDFLAFQDGFVAADPCACDIDTSTGPGVCDVFDFLAFQDGFVTGCP